VLGWSADTKRHSCYDHKFIIGNREPQSNYTNAFLLLRLILFLKMKSLSSLLIFVAFLERGGAFSPSSPLSTSTTVKKISRSSCLPNQNQGWNGSSTSLCRSLWGRKPSSSISLNQSDKGVDSGRDASDTKSISEVIDAVQSNLVDGELGSRGEGYFVLQIALILCILFGTVPVVGSVLNLVLGPGFVLLGGSVLSIGVVELGTNLTPWPSPPKNGSLVTDGLVFNEIRHPIYAGLIYLMFGISMWSGSAMRVLLCGVLWYLLDFKSDLEEDELVDKFGIDYIEYRERVKGKFVPSKLTEGIESTANKIGQSNEPAINDK